MGTKILQNAEPWKLSIAKYKIPGYTWVDKFGRNSDLDTGTQPETIWELGGVYPWGNDSGETMYISSSNDTDTQSVEFSVLTIDANDNWNLEVFKQQVAGQTKTQLLPPSGDPVVRIFSMENEGNTDIAGILYAYYDSTVNNGTPNDLTAVLSVIFNGSNQTKQLNYTVPTGYVGFLIRGEAGVGRGAGTDQVALSYRSRRFGKVFKTKKDFTLMTGGASIYKDERSIPDPIPAKTDLSIMTTFVSANNMTVWGTFDILLIEEDVLEAERPGYLDLIGQIRRV